MAADVVQVTTTVPTEDAASTIGAALLDAKVVACVQVDGPVRSSYWWQGAREDAVEWRCVAKTTAALADRAVAAIVEAHPYEVPEVLVTPVTGGHQAYLAWVATTVDD